MNKHFTIRKANLKDSFRMTQATKKDTEKVLALLLNTAKWFQDNGSSQWEGLLRGIDSHNTEVAIQKGNVFVCKKDEDIAGMVMLLQDPSEWDFGLWGDLALQDQDALYLHRLAINREYADHQLGSEILNWCQEGIYFENKNRIRLDCLAANEFLNAFYRRSGYTYLGEKDGYSLFELMLPK